MVVSHHFFPQAPGPINLYEFTEMGGGRQHGTEGWTSPHPPRVVQNGPGPLSSGPRAPGGGSLGSHRPTSPHRPHGGRHQPGYDGWMVWWPEVNGFRKPHNFLHFLKSYFSSKSANPTTPHLRHPPPPSGMRTPPLFAVVPHPRRARCRHSGQARHGVVCLHSNPTRDGIAYGGFGWDQGFMGTKQSSR